MSVASLMHPQLLGGHPLTDSLFLGAARAMDDFAIKQRIQAAVLFHAQSFLPLEQDKSYNYAVSALLALLAPQAPDLTMIALVCVSEPVASLVVVGENGEAVDTSQVPDGVILTQVQRVWPLVSEKYPTNPLTGDAHA